MKVIKSGNCIIGIVGMPTPILDFIGKPLFIGDLVKVFHFDSDSRISVDHGLSYVADDNFDTFTDGSVSCKGVSNPFVMGIKEVALGVKGEFGGFWHVKKIKRYNIKNRKGRCYPHSIEDIEPPVFFMRKKLY